MTTAQTFWPVPVNPGDPDLWVCLSCLGEVYWRKVPRPACPACGGVSTYEGFTLAAIEDWGTAELVAKAQAAVQAANDNPVETGKAK